MRTAPCSLYAEAPEAPARTRRVYSLKEIRPTRPNEFLPLYARSLSGKRGLTVGRWHLAESESVVIGNRKLAYRPGWHGVILPVFDQGKCKLKGGPRRVWLEVEIPEVSAATQAESDESQKLPNGMRSGITTRVLRFDESYDYKTNPSASGEAGGWPISGSVRVVRVVGDEEVAAVLLQAGLAHQVANSMTGVSDEEARWLTEAGAANNFCR